MHAMLEILFVRGRVKALVITALMLPPVIAQAAGTGGPPAAGSAGCLNQSKADCMASAARYMTVEVGPYMQFGQKKKVIDRNGKTVDASIATFQAKKVDKYRATVFLLTVAPDNTVLKAVATKGYPAIKGQTDNDYARDGVYELVDTLLGDKCVGDRRSFYKFLETEVKPKLGASQSITRSDAEGKMTVENRTASGIRLCNSLMNFTQMRGREANWATAGNAQGTFLGYTIKVE